jgi:hypothetical protein
VATHLAGLLAEAEHQGLGTDVRAVHEVARLRRRSDPAGFDQGWQAATGGVPAWLTIPEDHDDRVIAWMNTNSWSQSRDVLASTPELLDPATDVVLDEIALDPEKDELASVHRDLVAAARERGVQEAFAELVGVEAFRAWASNGYGRSYFAEHARELRHPAAVEGLGELAPWLPEGFEAFLVLLDGGEDDLAFRALCDDALVDWSGLLRPALEADDGARLWALGVLASVGATATDEAALLGRLSVGVARCLGRAAGTEADTGAAADTEAGTDTDTDTDTEADTEADTGADAEAPWDADVDPELVRAHGGTLLAAATAALVAHPDAPGLGTLVAQLRDALEA